MSIKDLKEIISLEDLYQFLKQSLIFYIKPRSYFKWLFSQTGEIQFKNSVYLFLLLSAFLYLFTDKQNFKIILGVSLLDVALCLISTVIIFCSNYFSSEREFSGFKNTFLFVFNSKFLLAPIYIIPYLGFIKTENYNFYFVVNVCFTYTFLFILAYSAMIFNQKIKNIIKVLLSNLLIFNLLLLLFGLFSLDWEINSKYSSFLADPIYNEYKSCSSKLKTTDTIVVNKIINYYSGSRKETILMLTTISDSLCHGSMASTESYVENLKKDLDVLKSSLLNAEYLRSKELMKGWESYLINIQNYYTEDVNVINDINKFEKIDKRLDESTNKIVYQITTYNNDKIFKDYIACLTKSNELINVSLKSEFIFNILYPYFILPSLLIGDKTMSEI